MLETKLEEERAGLFFGGEGDEGEKVGEQTGDSGELVLPPHSLCPWQHLLQGSSSWKQSRWSESNEEKLILNVAFPSSEKQSLLSF